MGSIPTDILVEDFNNNTAILAAVRLARIWDHRLGLTDASGLEPLSFHALS